MREAAVRECLEAHGLQREIDFQPRVQIRDTQLETLARALMKEMRSNGAFGGTMYVEALFAALLVQLVRCQSDVDGPFPSPPANGLSDGSLRRALDYMRDNCANSLTVDDVARAAHLSPFHFSRLFKAATGFAPHQYLLKVRVDRAKELLFSRPRLSLAQIAADVGFSDQGHLTRHFKRIEGVTPGAMRRG